VIKKRGLCIFIISFIVTIIIVFIAIAFFKFYTIVALPLWWLALAQYIFRYKKIMINSNSLTFDALARQKTLPFEVFKNADLCIMSGAAIYITGCVIRTSVNPKTKDGLIKIVTLSDKIVEKDKLIGKIERWAQLLER
jgi:hypothetical protein